MQPGSDIDQLREALAEAAWDAAVQPTFATWVSVGPDTRDAYLRAADAVLAVLEDWVSPNVHALQIRAWEAKVAEVEAENEQWKDAFNSRSEAARINDGTIRGLLSDNEDLRAALRAAEGGTDAAG